MSSNSLKESIPKIQPISSIKMMVIYILIIIVVVFVCYYVYIKFFSPKIAELYKPNNEQMPKWGSSTSSNEAELLFFYATWCPYCKSAKPEWEKVKKEYENKTINGYKVIFVDVDCTTPNNETNKLMDTYNVEGFPTIKLNKNGKQISYDAKVQSDRLIEFLKTAL
jgi:thiol-disulfide isomerase/thioredoxin